MRNFFLIEDRRQDNFLLLTSKIKERKSQRFQQKFFEFLYEQPTFSPVSILKFIIQKCSKSLPSLFPNLKTMTIQ